MNYLTQSQQSSQLALLNVNDDENDNHNVDDEVVVDNDDNDDNNDYDKEISRKINYFSSTDTNTDTETAPDEKTETSLPPLPQVTLTINTKYSTVLERCLIMQSF